MNFPGFRVFYFGWPPLNGLMAALLPAMAIILAGCAGTPDAFIGITDPEVPVTSVAGIRTRNIFVMTTRERDANSAVLYSGRRSDTLNFASMSVSIPPIHVVGTLEMPGNLPPDPRKSFTIPNATVYHSENGFLRDINNDLRGREPENREILVFVHGYNFTLTEAVLLLTQFVEDSGFQGVPVLFSWASRGGALDYFYDLNSALAARDDLIEGARLIIKTDARQIDVLAHSMGNLLTVEALRQAKIEGGFNRNGRLRNIVLASPDIDADLFKRQISVFPREERNFFIFISADDKALAASKRLSGGVPRVGNEDAAELAKLGVTVIDLTQVDASAGSRGHSKFASSPEVVQLIGAGLQQNVALSASRPDTGIIDGVTSVLLALPATVLQGGGRVVVLP
jgi:esterase/lipase superfamily enzyme